LLRVFATLVDEASDARGQQDDLTLRHLNTLAPANRATLLARLLVAACAPRESSSGQRSGGGTTRASALKLLASLGTAGLGFDATFVQRAEALSENAPLFRAVAASLERSSQSDLASLGDALLECCGNANTSRTARTTSNAATSLRLIGLVCAALEASEVISRLLRSLLQRTDDGDVAEVSSLSAGVGCAAAAHRGRHLDLVLKLLDAELKETEPHDRGWSVFGVFGVRPRPKAFHRHQKQLRRGTLMSCYAGVATAVPPSMLPTRLQQCILPAMLSGRNARAGEFYYFIHNMTELCTNINSNH
jgi:hypothetical protein